jgi:hypothetical protein
MRRSRVQQKVVVTWLPLICSIPPGAFDSTHPALRFQDEEFRNPKTNETGSVRTFYLPYDRVADFIKGASYPIRPPPPAALLKG